ncbi:subtilase-type protease inhibitor [Nocardia sp. NPDC088792]|uniref:subtilase-type protease inhibitor n=1 Tax=Nocardia sp. NPDC088792 TaxID=3364332 RepID=UPI003805AEA6
MSLGIRMASAAAGALAVLCTVAPAHAQPTDDGGPSAVTLTVAKGNSLDSSTDQRTVLLVCAPVQGGTHPDPAAACAEIAAAGGDFEKLRGHPERFCAMIYQPVTLAADGVWNGHQINYRQTFPNQCQADNRSTTVFHF